MCSSTFQRENNKELTVRRVLLWPALFLLIITLLGDVASGLKWRRLRPYSPLSSAYIVADLLYKQNIRSQSSQERGGRLWHRSKVDKNPPALICKKGFLLKPLAKELTGKWRLWPPNPQLSRNLHIWSLGDFGTNRHMGKWRLCPNPPVLGENPHLRGGGWLGLPS